MKKEIIIPLFIVLLGFLFVIINIVVFLTKGNSWFIHKKLKVGALILTLTSIAACHTAQTPTCYKTSTTIDNSDSTEYMRIKDSIQFAKNQKHIDDSIANVNEEKRKKDSIANIKVIKGDSIQPTCYKPPPQKTCYAPVRKD